MERPSCHISRRFEFLRSGIPGDWHVVDVEIVPQTMVWTFPHMQVWWEHHDGVIDEVPFESFYRAWLCWNSHDKNKQFVYVKPTFSLEKCRPLSDFIASVGGRLLTCERWSYYNDVIIHGRLHVDRRSLRKSNKTHDVVFYGTALVTKHDMSVYVDDDEYPRGIAGCDAETILGIARPKPVYHVHDRNDDVKRASATWSNFQHRTNLHPCDFARNVLPTTTWLYQPLGTGLRHSIYEGMSLGIPSVIPENSYINDTIRRCNIVQNTLPKVLPERGSREYREISERCIDTYERFMTPEAIVNSVLHAIK